MVMALLAEREFTVTHEFSRLQSLTEWWQWLALILICGAIAVYVVRWYRRDGEELSRGLALLLMLLRIGALIGVLFYFLDLERRTERRLVKDSRVIMLVDTSQSMGIVDSDSRSSGQNRLAMVAQELGNGTLIPRLRERHDVVLYRFDQSPRPTEVATYAKLPSTRLSTNDDLDPTSQLVEARWVTAVAVVFILAAITAVALGWLRRASAGKSEASAWLLLTAFVLGIAGCVVLAVATLRSPGFDLGVTLGLRTANAEIAASERNAIAKEPDSPPDLSNELGPRGSETRIGDAIDFVVSRERGGPIAGIVLITDGGQNAGQAHSGTLMAARDAGIPIFAIGIGSDKRPTNVRVVDLEVPERLYPGDRFTLTGMIQSFGFAGRAARVELFSQEGKGESWPTISDEELRVKLPPDGEILPVKFEVEPQPAGTRSFKVRVTMAEKDSDEKDNERTATVQIVDRKTKVLLFAGGPSRDYQFLRNMLNRDQDTVVDVLLQTAQPGVSQDATDILYEFPSTTEELYDYDCLVAFDPDWEALSAAQARLLERWIGEEAGGLVVIAGPVHTPRWSSKRTGDQAIDIVKALYPVVFYYQGAATLSLGRFGGDRAWPLTFTPDGLNAEFLWLADDAVASEQTWKSFEGVYGFYAVKDPKPGARIYSLFSDPDTSIDNQLPIYMAGHFYGAGRVFFQASGEMWRVRSVDDTYFDTFYTKLIRWASQGRLLRDSKHGLLMVDKDRALIGEQIIVRALLHDSQRRPLVAPQVTAAIISPDGKRTSLELRPTKDADREGLFGGQLVAMMDGDYYVELLPPGAAADELLRKEVRVRVPALEIEKAERNNALLSEIAQVTNGEYYIGLPAATVRTAGGLVDRLVPQDQITFLPGTPDKDFERILMGWLMAIICGLLCFEWLIRRLSKLA